jgi:flagellar hook protein FlgE
MFTGVSGLINNGEAMNVIGNNISNVNTIGFKYGRTLFSDMLSANIGNNSQIGRGVQIQKVDNVFGQGSFQSTENTTDLALQGDSYFVLGDPNTATGATVTNANAYFTRAGAFRVDSNTNLINPDGYKVLSNAGSPINFAADVPAGGTFSKITKVDSDGTITYMYKDAAGISQARVLGGAAPVKLGAMMIQNTGSLVKTGGTLFKGTVGSAPTDTWTAASSAFTSLDGASERVFSNSLELSNVDMASQFVQMITTQRAYSANSKTITTVDQMTQDVLNIIR